MEEGPTDPLAFPDRHKLLKWWAQSFPARERPRCWQAGFRNRRVLSVP